MYKSQAKLPPALSSPDEDDEYDDAISDVSTSTWKTSASSQKSGYTTASSLNNNCSGTRRTISYTQVVTIPAHHLPHHSPACHSHSKGHNACSCIKNFYEEDEVCRKNKQGHLEFGIVTKYGDKSYLKILWTLGNTVEEQTIDPTDGNLYSSVWLIDRRSVPGDIIYVNKKRGEVIDVSWTCHLQLLENNMSVLNIPCDNLEPLVPHYAGQKLEYSGWLGTITSVTTEATLMFTGLGKTGVMDCSTLPYVPYPGRKARYTVGQYINAKLRFADDKRPISQIFRNSTVVEAFVLFMNVTNVEVKWNGRIRVDGEASTPILNSEQPPTTLSKSNLKKHARVLGTIKDMDWEASHDAVDKYFQYTVNDDDLVVSEGGIEDYIKSSCFDEVPKNLSCVSVKDLRKKGSKICINVRYNVKVIRFNRLLKVKWASSGKIENIPARLVSSVKSYKQKYHQIVQKSLSLAPYSYDEYGVTLSNQSNDTVLVQWFGKTRENSKPPFKFIFHPIYQTPEPVFNLEPHFAFGAIEPRQIVYRSVYCRVPEALFTLGWVRSVTEHGTVIVVSVHSKQELMVYPSELETTGIKVDENPDQPSSFKLSRYTDMVKIHGLQKLLKAEKIFIQNLSIKDCSSFPEHFTLLQQCPVSHTFYKNVFSVRSDGHWMRAVKKDQLFLTTRMNDEIGSIWIKGFRDRLDLFSVLMTAPPGTPYEGGLYSLDLQLCPDYPTSPPAIYLHTSVGQLRPGTQNLELQDNVIPPHSLVESLIALQGTLFTSSDPFEIPSSAASLQRRKVDSKDCEERLRNARVIIDVLDLLFRLVLDPPKLWTTEIINYFHMTFERNKERLLGLIDVTNPYSNSSEGWIIPTFPLMPVSDGFIDAVLARIKRFEELIEQSAL